MVADPKNFTRQAWTYDEVSSIEDDVRRELYDGEIIEMPSPSINHQDIILRLALLFAHWASRFGGKAIISPVDLYISDRLYFIPDFVFYTSIQMEDEDVLRNPKRLTVPPALIVEVLSESTARNDRVRKLHAYAQFGVANYWLVDPAQQTLEAFALRDGLYQIVAAHEEAEVFAPATFPDLLISLPELFAP
ncbi:Uma2 family endonuclease [bacterium]|nr:MAG: Uma2 family endonuclease [bacterium]